MPKVELHVHLEGSIQPETILELAQRHHVCLPADTVQGVREWFEFVDFPHFVDVYLTISNCMRTADDIELVARRFLREQARQNIRYSEVTYTAFTHYLQHDLEFDVQLAALNRARTWAENELGVSMGIVIDIPRNIPAEHGSMIADWAIAGMRDGVVAFGLGGPEVGHPPEKFATAFERVAAAGLPSVPHAGENAGAESVWGALNVLNAARIGHGVRCLEDPRLVAELRRRQIPLEVCPTSNVCLGVVPNFAAHPLPQLMEEGLYVTLNSDDPPMFDTALTREHLKAAKTFGFDVATIEGLVLNAVRASFLEVDAKRMMESEFAASFQELRAEYSS